jgi:hypothetical protein
MHKFIITENHDLLIGSAEKLHKTIETTEKIIGGGYVKRYEKGVFRFYDGGFSNVKEITIPQNSVCFFGESKDFGRVDLQTLTDAINKNGYKHFWLKDTKVLFSTVSENESAKAITNNLEVIHEAKFDVSYCEGLTEAQIKQLVKYKNEKKYKSIYLQLLTSYNNFDIIEEYINLLISKTN